MSLQQNSSRKDLRTGLTQFLEYAKMESNNDNLDVNCMLEKLMKERGEELDNLIDGIYHIQQFVLEDDFKYINEHIIINDEIFGIIVENRRKELFGINSMYMNEGNIRSKLIECLTYFS